MREIGFVVLEGHGVDPGLFETAESWVEQLFTGSTLDEKMAFRAARHGAVSEGYFPIHETSDIHPDLVEGWVFCRRAFEVDGRRSDAPVARFWPDVRFEPQFRALVQDNERLILPVMQSLLMYLDHDPHTFDARLTQTNIGLRLNYYPPLDHEAANRAGRLLGHEDVGMFTLLPAPQVEGLQVLNRRSGKWVRLNAPRGSMILNTGEYMQRISNDILPSTTHRVGRPRDDALLSQPRVSFFR